MREERQEARNGDGGGACGHPTGLVTFLREMTDEENGARVADRVGSLNHADLFRKKRVRITMKACFKTNLENRRAE